MNDDDNYIYLLFINCQLLIIFSIIHSFKAAQDKLHR